MPNPWDIPYSPMFKDGDDTDTEVFCAVGKCLSRWEDLESEISTLFAVLTGSMDQWHYGPAIRAFGVVNSIPTRADMIRKAAEAFFSQLNAEYEEAKSLQLDLNTRLDITSDGLRAETTLCR